ncbi:hypothetical protein [Microbacterium deminutum]|uniref:Terminase n=1 Tax=Microbacterium deminutum TaxID=344164 RepID=A0ABP5BVI0_9MICO
MNDTDVKPVRAPVGLGIAGRALWKQIAADWAENESIPDAREARLLADACREADVLAFLQAELDRLMKTTGTLTTFGAQGQLVTHPHVGEARRSRAQIASLLKSIELAAEQATDGTAGLPAPRPMTLSEAGRKGGLARVRGQRRG